MTSLKTPPSSSYKTGQSSQTAQGCMRTGHHRHPELDQQWLQLTCPGCEVRQAEELGWLAGVACCRCLGRKEGGMNDVGERESVLSLPCLRPKVLDYSHPASPQAPNRTCPPLGQTPVFLSCSGPADKRLTSSSRCWYTAVSHALLKVQAVQRAPEGPWGQGWVAGRDLSSKEGGAEAATAGPRPGPALCSGTSCEQCGLSPPGCPSVGKGSMPTLPSTPMSPQGTGLGSRWPGGQILAEPCMGHGHGLGRVRDWPSLGLSFPCCHVEIRRNRRESPRPSGLKHFICPRPFQMV